MDEAVEDVVRPARRRAPSWRAATGVSPWNTPVSPGSGCPSSASGMASHTARAATAARTRGWVPRVFGRFESPIHRRTFSACAGRTGLDAVIGGGDACVADRHTNSFGLQCGLAAGEARRQLSQNNPDREASAAARATHPARRRWWSGMVTDRGAARTSAPPSSLPSPRLSAWSETRERFRPERIFCMAGTRCPAWASGLRQTTHRALYHDERQHRFGRKPCPMSRA